MIGRNYTLRAELEGSYVQKNEWLKPSTQKLSNRWELGERKFGIETRVGFGTGRDQPWRSTYRSSTYPSVRSGTISFIRFTVHAGDYKEKVKPQGRSCISISKTHVHERVGLSRR